jgi:hypothetical protein
MTSQKVSEKRFRYPLYYIVFFSITLLISGPISLYMIFENIQLKAAFVILGISLLLLYMLYELTQTILIDRQGIAQDSFIGELRRFSWSEIQGIKPSRNIFSPGFKVYNDQGEAIEISAMLGKYDEILELLRRAQVEVRNQPLTTLSQKTGIPVEAVPVSDFALRASKYSWSVAIMMVVIIAPLFIGSFIYQRWISLLILGIFLLIVVAFSIYGYNRVPILVATRGEILYIKFRSKSLRKNIRVRAVDVREVTLHHHRTLTPQGGVHAETGMVLYLWEKTKVDLSRIGPSHEDLYLKLNAWLEKYGNLEPKDQVDQ